MQTKYKRILLKLSGEALAGEKKFGLNYDVITDICKSIRDAAALGVEIAIVVGGGNFGEDAPAGRWIVPERITSACSAQR